MEKIYHYTNASGLLGILNGGDKKFWLTKSNFLNDSTEIKYGKKIFDSVLREMIDKEILLENHKSEIEGLLKHLLKFHCYIGSFSTESDSLTMWRFYGSNDGYCLTFNKQSLLKTFKKKCNKKYFVSHGKVIYDVKKQHAKLTKAILNLVKGISPIEKILSEKNKNKTIKVLNLLYLFKDPSFQDENEYRLFAIVPDKEDKKLKFPYEDWKLNTKFRTSNGVFIPYIEVKLNVEEKEYIRLGPLLKNISSSQGLELYCEKHDIEVEIVHSNSSINSY